MTVPAREVKVGWRVNPGTPSEWVVARSNESNQWTGHRPERWVLHDDDTIFMRVPPDQLVVAVPPSRMITVPAMDDETLKHARSLLPVDGWQAMTSSKFYKWLRDAIAAQEREAT